MLKIDWGTLRVVLMAAILVPFVVGILGIYGFVRVDLAVQTFLTGLMILMPAAAFTLLARVPVPWLRAGLYLFVAVEWLVGLLSIWQFVSSDAGFKAFATGVAILMASGAMAFVSSWQIRAADE